MRHRVSIDRFERDGRRKVAVLLTEDGTQINVPKVMLPKGAKPGDILTMTFEVDREATEQVARETRAVHEELFEDDQGGDLKL